MVGDWGDVWLETWDFTDKCMIGDFANEALFA
jgi:hypothetical protein